MSAMNKLLPSLLAVLIPSAAAAQVAAVGASCLALPETVQVGRGIFANDYEVKAAGQKVGEVRRQGDDYVLVAADGSEAARAVLRSSEGKQTAVVTGCGGAALGAIEELSTSEASAFNFKDAGGAPSATSGWVSGGSMRAAAGAVSIGVQQNGIFDRFTVTAKGVDPKVAVIAAVMNNAAGYRRASERRRERIGDGPHGRGDR